MLTVSLLLTGVLGLLQEKTYTRYGPCWKEGLFYTVSTASPHTGPASDTDPARALAADLSSLHPERPARLPQPARRDAARAGRCKHVRERDIPTRTAEGAGGPHAPRAVPHARQQPHHAARLRLRREPAHLRAPLPPPPVPPIADHSCYVQRVSSVSTNLVLTTRKAISLCFSVWWFGNGWNEQLGVGAGMVFLGSILYTIVTSRSPAPKAAPAKTALSGQRHKRE